MDNNGYQPQQPQQPMYNQQYQPPYNGSQNDQPMTLGDWILTLIVLAIPCVSIIMLFVWGFGDGNTSRKNYCRAVLIFAAIGVVLGLIFSSIIASAFRSFSYGF